jgi:putative membrane protein
VQWATIQNSSRVLMRQLVAATTNSVAAGTASPEAAASYRRDMAARLIAFANSLAARLRGTSEPIAANASLPADVRELAGAADAPNLLLQSVAVRVRDGARDGLLGQFDPMMLEPQLAAINGAATTCERIKHTPTPRQYDYFTRLAVAGFSTLLPFGLLGVLPPTDAWWAVPLTAVIAGVFIVLERVGAVLDAPFANTVNDVPITAISRDIERDLLEQLGDLPLPDPEPVVAGYLW